MTLRSIRLLLKKPYPTEENPIIVDIEKMSLLDMERYIVNLVKKECKDNRTEMSKILGISPRTLRNRRDDFELKKLNGCEGKIIDFDIEKAISQFRKGYVIKQIADYHLVSNAYVSNTLMDKMGYADYSEQIKENVQIRAQQNYLRKQKKMIDNNAPLQ